LTIPALSQTTDNSIHYNPPKEHDARVFRLESVVVDPISWSIRINVSSGHENTDGEWIVDRFLPEYVMDVDSGKMTFEGQSVRIPEEHVELVDKVIKLISDYASKAVRDSGLREESNGKKKDH
jgi:hypothetical protein